MKQQMSPKEAKPAIQTMTRLPSDTAKPSKATKSLKDHPTILTAGNSSNDALPDLTILRKAELDSCFKHRWDTKSSIDHSTVEGKQQWLWVTNSFCSLYSGADLNNKKIFTMFQIHMAFTDRNEDDPGKPFKFGILNAYCDLTSRNKDLSKRKQNWRLDLDALRKLIDEQETKKDNEEPDPTPSKVPKASVDVGDQKVARGSRGESDQPTENSTQKRKRADREKDEGEQKDLEEAGTVRKKLKVKGPSSKNLVKKGAEPKPRRKTRTQDVRKYIK